MGIQAMGFFDSLPVRLFSIFTVSIAAISVLAMTTIAVEALNQPTNQAPDIMATNYPNIPFEDATDISEQLSPMAEMENSETIQNIQNIEPAAGE